jgi:hypothetical protein
MKSKSSAYRFLNADNANLPLSRALLLPQGEGWDEGNPINLPSPYPLPQGEGFKNLILCFRRRILALY